MAKSLRNYFRFLAEDRETGPLSKVMYPLLEKASHLYEMGSCKMRSLYEGGMLKSSKLDFPVISVGNLTWGGSGKTPLVEYLARVISEMNKTPLVLTRGYSHDEVEQYREHLPNVLLGVGKNRYKTAKKISAKYQVDMGVLDDGFQHWKMFRDLEVIALNSLNPFGNGHIIPRGSLREPKERLSQSDVIVLTHTNLVPPPDLRNLKKEINKFASHALIVESYLEPLFFYRAKKGQKVALEKLQNKKVTTFSAVGVPRSFQLILANNSIKPVRNFEFTDHHVFSNKDLDEIKSISKVSSSDEIITTEKDFYRAPDRITKHLNPLVLATELRISKGEQELLSRIRNLLGVRS